MEVKIKNITVSVDGQEFSFTAKSLVAGVEYDAKKDPDVQGVGLPDLQSSVSEPAMTPVEPENAPTDTKIEETPEAPKVDLETPIA